MKANWLNALLLTLILLSTFVAPLPARAESPAFQAPFPCGQIWRASTYEGHNSNAIDIVERNANLDIIGEDQPAIASAPGKIVFDYTWPSGSKKDERWVIVDHQDGWRTHYFHLAAEEGRPRLAIGRKVAMGEVLGHTSNSGASAVHIHYAQINNVSRDADNLASQAANPDNWQRVLSDGDTKRVRFDDSAIDTYYANRDSWGHFNDSQSEKIRSHNCPGGQFVHWYSGGDSYILRYNPGNAQMRINQIHPTDDENPQMFNQNWGANWTNVLAFYSRSNQPHLMQYNFASGKVRFSRVNPGNDGTTFLKSFNIYAGWTHFVPVVLNGEAHVVSYDSRYGWFNVDDIKPTSDGFVNALKTKIKEGFTQIVPYEEGPNRYLLMYNGATGSMALQQLKLNTDGKVTREMVWSDGRSPGWTNMVPLQHGGTTYIVGYNSETGRAKVWRPKRNGGGIEGVQELSWSKGWSSLTPYRHNGRGHILVYRLSDGLARKIRLRDDLSGFQIFMNKNWARGFR